MKVPIYILGFLHRYGSLHGYKLKQLISMEVSDFTRIKLPTIYYHLEKLEKSGLVTAETEQDGKRPERSVYTITEKGIEEFRIMLKDILKISYTPEFPLDAALYFGDSVDMNDITKRLEDGITELNEIVAHIERHNEDVMAGIPDTMKPLAQALFNHHLYHYRAEIAWARETLETLDH